MLARPLCSAKTRAGGSCRSPVQSKRRCRMHGGARESGARPRETGMRSGTSPGSPRKSSQSASGFGTCWVTRGSCCEMK
ncbi:HGGxSTG domain-containing protein [Bradyrhizobium sp. LB14.3]|uniref:HGGxSTG domain-containing protein n=1 Tax=Bradyrhizobium sp. LB14.3 TaxID=3156328 RepID=UPI00339960EB